MTRAFGPLLLVATTALTTSVFAQEPVAEGETPRDPKGITGISPFWEAVNKGDAAFLAQDLEGATNSYQEAITSEPKNALGHLRMAELSLKQNELTRAQGFITSALRFSGDNIRHKAAASFLLAELREQQAAYDDATDSWNKYKAIDSQLPANAEAPAKGPLPAKVYTETADKRLEAIATKKKLDEEYAAVKERIKKNVDKAEAATGAAAGKK